MIHIEVFPFNPFQMNTIVLWDDTNECVIIDPGMHISTEEQQLVDFITEKNLKPVELLLTHAHIDHIIGCAFIADKYKLKLKAHSDGNFFLKDAEAYGSTFGITIDKVIPVESFIVDGDEVKFGDSVLKVLFTPGHADGSVCYYSAPDNMVVTGDVLFNQSIGRTDLPTGDYDKLQKSIWEKLFTLPDSTVVYPGHGPSTTIGNEKTHNPFVAIGKE